MTIIAVCSAKQSPGATTLALALTAVLAEHGTTVLVEADPAGGDIAVVSGFPTDPGIATFAAAARHDTTPAIGPHTRPRPAGGSIVAAPTDPSQARNAVAVAAPHLPPATAAAFDHLVVDCGRLSAGSAATPLLAAADRTLVVVRPTIAAAAQIWARLADIVLLTGGRAALVVVGNHPRFAAELEDLTRLPVDGMVPFDDRGADGLYGSATRRTVSRSPLVRAVRTMSDRTLADLIPADLIPPVVSSVADRDVAATTTGLRAAT